MAQAAAQHGERGLSAEGVFQMVENMPINVLMADLDLRLVYVNRASRETLRTLQEYLPVSVDDLVGQSIDVFHRNPLHQRRMLADPSNLPHTARIRVGPEWLDLDIAAIHVDGEYVGAMVSWSVVTRQAILEAQREELEQGIRSTSGRLTEAAAELRRISQALDGAVQQTSQEIDSLTSRTHEVDGNAQAVAAASEEMSASIGEIARSAAEATRVAEQAVQRAAETDQTVSSLGTSSQEISEVLRVITSIAQQTNLLALNATIEAARAGEAGRGFAVVAGEVKELAKETARATEDIRARIEAIQHDTDRSVSAIREIGGIIQNISEIQGSIAAAVDQQSAVTDSISENASTAANSTATMLGSSTRVIEASTRAAQAVDDATRASATLLEMARELDDQVRRIQG